MRHDLTIWTERGADDLAELADGSDVPEHRLLKTGHVLKDQVS
jgi:hypothetical protein